MNDLIEFDFYFLKNVGATEKKIQEDMKDRGLNFIFCLVLWSAPDKSRFKYVYKFHISCHRPSLVPRYLVHVGETLRV